MGDIWMIKGGACLEAPLKRGGSVVDDVVDHSGSIGPGVYRSEDGEETISTRKHMHNKTISGARGDLT